MATRCIEIKAQVAAEAHSLPGLLSSSPPALRTLVGGRSGAG